MLRVILKSPYSRTREHVARFWLQTRHFSSTMSPHEESRHVFFTIDASNGVTTDSNARTGVFNLRGRRGLETPNFLGICSRGAIPHITSDVLLEHTKVGGVYMALEDCEFELS
jgi:hypothetical protein